MGDEGQGEAMVRARFRVNGAGVGLPPPRGDLVTVRGRWAGRDGGERTQQEAFADRTGASWRGRSVGRTLDQLQTGRQVGSGIARSRARALLNWVLPRPALWQMQGEAACRAGEPSGQGEEPPPEGLGGHWSARPDRAVPSSGPGCGPSPVPPVRRRWRRSGRTACGSDRRRT